MKTPNYLVELGDTWSINELSSAVRQGGIARANAQNFVRCLYDGDDGSVPPAKGNVFVVGRGQSTGNMSVYKPNLRGVARRFGLLGRDGALRPVVGTGGLRDPPLRPVSVRQRLSGGGKAARAGW